MHTARSRNDIDLTLYRMTVRREVLKIAAASRRGQGATTADWLRRISKP